MGRDSFGADSADVIGRSIVRDIWRMAWFEINGGRVVCDQRLIRLRHQLQRLRSMPGRHGPGRAQAGPGHL
ncbi:Protein of unknown function [Micromonospora lupini str. Lupac 08]|uniref:Uncharacterized protein n=1 Tax=Micromonospora lupini str. Lupac 08 TaxID=1150864 RepID=I0LCP7_9ACTN|nr:Protein of unknown function [Micromonospora lupini str. Lupac 08]